MKAAAADSAPPPILRLYAHALESVFAFATLRDLSALMAVCSSWQTSVMQMRSVRCHRRWHGRKRGWQQLQQSRLAQRHIAHLDLRSEPDPNQIGCTMEMAI